MGFQPYNPSQDPYLRQDMAMQNYFANQYNKQLQQGLQQGRARGEEIYGAGTPYGQMVDLYRQRLQGFTSPEYASLRGQQTQDIGRQYQTALRNLQKQQAYSGTRGAAASAQIANLGRERIKTASDAYQNLMIRNIDEKNRNLDRYNQALSSQLGGQLGLEFGYGQLRSGQMAAAQNAWAARQKMMNESKGK